MSRGVPAEIHKSIQCILWVFVGARLSNAVETCQHRLDNTVRPGERELEPCIASRAGKIFHTWKETMLCSRTSIGSALGRGGGVARLEEMVGSSHA